jgi:hypothetical protein
LFKGRDGDEEGVPEEELGRQEKTGEGTQEEEEVEEKEGGALFTRFLGLPLPSGPSSLASREVFGTSMAPHTPASAFPASSSTSSAQ